MATTDSAVPSRPPSAPRAALLQTVLFLAVIVITGVLALRGIASFDRPADAPVVTGQLAKRFETHYDESFPAKRFGVNLWAAIGLRVFGEGRPRVVLGREQWLYTSEEFNVGDGSARQLKVNLATIAWVHAQLKAQGIPLVVAIVPAKARVYPEFLDGHAPARLQQSLHEQLVAALAARGIPTADLLPTLVAAKAEQPTYFRTDTHWTPFGAQRAAALVAALVAERGHARAADQRTRYVTTLGDEQRHRGDLFNYLPLDPYFASLLPPTDVVRPSETVATDSTTASDPADLFGDAAAPQVTLVGSSYSANPLWNFAGALREALGEDIANLSKEGVGPFPPMIQYLTGAELKQVKPRLVIWEIPERALIVKPDLHGFVLPSDVLNPP